MNKIANNRNNRGTSTYAYFDDVCNVVRRFYEHNSYKRDPRMAVRYLLRKYPNESKVKHLNNFNAVFVLFHEAIFFVNEHSQLYWEEFHKMQKDKKAVLPEDRNPNLVLAEKKFKRKFRHLPERAVDNAIGWHFYWHHLR